MDRGFGELIGFPGRFAGTGPEAAEAFRAQHCPTCMRHETAQARRNICVEVRCHLCDPAMFAEERLWVGRTLLELWPPAEVNDGALARFNAHLARWGAVTFAFARNNEGLVRQVWQGRTLRGQIHGAMVESLMIIVGETIRFHADADLTLETIRDAAKARRTQRRRWNAAHLRETTKLLGSIRAGAKEGGLPRSTARYALDRLKRDDRHDQ